MSDQPLLSRLDLNLLVALDALLTERSVTRAAERLHLSQPALSASLARLRTHFNDPILARRGNTYELTPLALRLTEHTTTALDAARRVFESQAIWTPHDSTREFSIYGSDYGFATIGTMVSRLAAEQAPGVRLRFMLHNPSIVDDAVNRLRSVDGMVIPHGHLTDLPYMDLWRDDWIVVASESNEHIDDELTMEVLGRLPCLHIPDAHGVHVGGTPASAARRRAARRGRRRELPRASALHRGDEPARAPPGRARRLRVERQRHPGAPAPVRRDARRQRAVVASGSQPRPRAHLDARALRAGIRPRVRASRPAEVRERA
ncbi:LysR family transcriptional regulator [Microbacterium immunditiarum]|uniref:DNA-binding transcriptional LysR family regulator n=1 Tax=Microbacterium immunditiarum TaxID=337480 RepID=A0A7Y9KJX9_9MICO|nr:DNA-binding transcriptional LysR family regulator [Microbacterium immunditiarum]